MKVSGTVTSWMGGGGLGGLGATPDLWKKDTPGGVYLALIHSLPPSDVSSCSDPVQNLRSGNKWSVPGP